MNSSTRAGIEALDFWAVLHRYKGDRFIETALFPTRAAAEMRYRELLATQSDPRRAGELAAVALQDHTGETWSADSFGGEQLRPENG